MAAAEAYFCYKQECSHLLFRSFKKLADHIRTELIRTIRQIFLLREVGQGAARPIRSHSGYFLQVKSLNVHFSLLLFAPDFSGFWVLFYKKRSVNIFLQLCDITQLFASTNIRMYFFSFYIFTSLKLHFLWCKLTPLKA